MTTTYPFDDMPDARMETDLLAYAEQIAHEYIIRRRRRAFQRAQEAWGEMARAFATYRGAKPGDARVSAHAAFRDARDRMQRQIAEWALLNEENS